MWCLTCAGFCNCFDWSVVCVCLFWLNVFCLSLSWCVICCCGLDVLVLIWLEGVLFVMLVFALCFICLLLGLFSDCIVGLIV